MSSHNVVLLLGSNINFPKQNIAKALIIIEDEVSHIVKKSKIIETMPEEFDSINFFCNIAIVIETQLSPMKLLQKVKAIEMKMGRAQDSKMLGGYHDRIIDIDIVTYDRVEFVSEKLQIPHYRHLKQREFSKRILDEL